MTTRTVTVLVVDAEVDRRRALGCLAEAAGFVSEDVGTLAELEARLQAAQPAEPLCVLLAMRLPDGDATAALALCQRTAARPPVVLLRDEEDAEALLAAWSAGAAGYLARAASQAELAAAVVKATRWSPRMVAASPSDGTAASTRPLRVIQATCHDLRNPLSAMMINANILLREESLGEERRVKIANRLLASANRMNRMIEDLADYAVAAQGKVISVRPTETDLGAIASEAMREVRAAHPGRSIVLEQRGDLRGHWDPGRLRQVMHSLLGSALKRGRPGAVVVVGCAESASAPEVEIDFDYRLEVDAQGNPGDGTEWQAAPAPDGDEASLFVAGRIADAHHGSLTVSAADPVGPRFVMRLPKRAPAADAVAARSA